MVSLADNPTYEALSYTKLCPKSYATALVKQPIGMVMVFANV
jgi:hypothetical protein